MVSIRDQMPLGRRWSLSVFVSAMSRSVGTQSIPLSYGGISLPGYGILLALMVIGGSVSGIAGGIRTTALTLPPWLLISGKAVFPAGQIIRRVLLAVLVLIAGNLIAILLLRSITDGTWYEIAFDAMSAWNSVGLSTGLSLHLTSLGRLVMILLFMAGRLAPIVCWILIVAPCHPPARVTNV